MQIKLNEKILEGEAPVIHPTIFIIFGITGDLASRKLLPALLALYTKKMLPPRFSIVGFSRRAFSREEFREFIRSRLNIKPGQFREEEIKHFFDHITYEQGHFDDLKSYTNLAERLKGVDDRWGECSNKLFHLSVPPTLYETILSKVHDSGLSLPCSDSAGWTRILIEKPFGNDIETAEKLDDLLGKLFKEEQIFRIDHYLAKESLQNILAFRFTNSIFEALWSREYIEKVHIKLFEKNTMEGRGAFYDPIGALKDVGQNHILQMLALVAMDKPKSFKSSDVRKERSKVLSSLKLVTKKTLDECVVKGQYIGYLEETGVVADSPTETFFRIKANIDSLRWKGVNFYLESGKAMSESKTEIDIYFKPDKSHEEEQNILTFRVQPDEGIKIRFMVKTPGYGFNVEPKILKFKYSENTNFNAKPDDYERLIFDSIIGDQTLFASTAEIMASWIFVTSIIKAWKSLPLLKYEKGTKEVY